MAYKFARTHLILVLDESLSMEKRRQEVMTAVNEHVARYDDEDTRYSFIRFAANVVIAVNGRPLSEFEPLTELNYIHRPGSAVRDAITEAIRHGDDTRRGDEMIRVTIFTDGLDNSSRSECNQEVVAKVMSYRTSLGYWEFDFVGEQLMYDLSTHIIVVLDESGSMEDNTYASYNTFLATQKRVAVDDVRFSLIKFNDDVTVVHENEPLARAPTLNQLTYWPDKNTALYDAMYRAIEVGDRHRVGGERVLCLVITDGEENASKRVTANRLKEVIREKNSRGNWTFVYIGEQPAQIAADFDVAGGNVAEYNHEDACANFELAATACTLYLASEKKSTEQFFACERLD